MTSASLWKPLMVCPLLAAHSGTVVHLSHQTEGLGSSMDFLFKGWMLLQRFPKKVWQQSCFVLTGIGQVLSNLENLLGGLD